ncbi:unnamed protein product [Knipowitschia caucasica]|uniref:Uncharacterized protein n=1 Tax=Knipowitschia caucasica TaxID=637954 RepID=A0AAV2KZG0_KNICA
MTWLVLRHNLTLSLSISLSLQKAVHHRTRLLSQVGFLQLSSKAPTSSPTHSPKNCSNWLDCNASLTGVHLHYSIKQQLGLDENCQIKLKKDAKRLSADYGSSDAVLRAAREDDTAAFEAAAAKHKNAELRAFQKRPKSALSRLFSRMRRAFTF